MVIDLYQPSVLVVLLAGLALALGCSTPSGAATSKSGILWHEGEQFASATDQSEKQWDHRTPASGGKALYGGTLDDKDREVTWKVNLGGDIDEAQIIFRYARLHWRDTMVPASMKVSLSGPGNAEAQIEFPNTGGWGRAPQEYGLASAALGNVAKGSYIVKLTSLTDNNSITVDGFFIAPSSFKVTADELAGLRTIEITSDGYLGIRSAAIIRQDQEPFVWAAAESFSGEARPPKAALYPPTERPMVMGKPVELRVADEAKVEQYGFSSWKYALPKLPDGEYTVTLTGEAPRAKLAAPLMLAGELLGSLPARLAKLEAFAARDNLREDVNAAVCLTDVEHIIEYLKTNAAQLTGDEKADENPWAKGLAFHEGAAATSPVVANMRRALKQAEAAVARVEAHKSPYEAAAGDLRRAFKSAKDSRMNLYRMYVPTSYAKADTVPLILFLHGGGGDEDYWPDLEDGRILKHLEQRGYMAVMPAWHSRRFGAHWRDDMMQLVNLTRKEWPKVDPKRIYVTGISMGGFGTYAMTTTYPDVFAAACCVSGTGKIELAEKLKDVPLLVFQGGADTVVPPAGAKRVDARLQELGYAHELHVFPTYGHGYHADEYMKLTLDWFDKYAKK